MKLSQLIVNYRKEHNLSQRQMAGICDLSPGYISLIEKEISPQTGKPMFPTLKVLNKLAKGMGMTVDTLISMCDDMTVDITTEKPTPKHRDGLSDFERAILAGYHAAPDHVKKAVDTLLEVPQQKE